MWAALRGRADFAREASVLKQLLRAHAPEDVETALIGLREIFKTGDISLRMLYGKSRIGGIVGFRAAYEAGIKASPVGNEGPALPHPGRGEKASTAGLASISSILATVGWGPRPQERR